MASYIINGVLSIVTAILVYLLKDLIGENKKLREAKAKEDKARGTALSNGVLSLLRIQLIEYHDKYMTRDAIPLYVFENWDDMYKAYSDLGGNGTVKRMNDDIQAKRIGGGHEGH